MFEKNPFATEEEKKEKMKETATAFEVESLKYWKNVDFTKKM